MPDDEIKEDIQDTTEPNVGGTNAQAAPKKETTKAQLAGLFVGSFIFVVGVLPLSLLTVHTITVDGYKDIVLTLSGILAGPLGIIINSYFRDGSEK